MLLEEQKHSTGLVWREAKSGSLQIVAHFSGRGEKKPEEQVLFYLLEYIHDGVVQLSEHHEVDRKAGAAILSGRVTRKPGQCIVLLQNEPAERNTETLNCNHLLLPLSASLMIFLEVSLVPLRDKSHVHCLAGLMLAGLVQEETPWKGENGKQEFLGLRCVNLNEAIQV